jgi:hypothetical protein
MSLASMLEIAARLLAVVKLICGKHLCPAIQKNERFLF